MLFRSYQEYSQNQSEWDDRIADDIDTFNQQFIAIFPTDIEKFPFTNSFKNGKGEKVTVSTSQTSLVEHVENNILAAERRSVVAASSGAPAAPPADTDLQSFQWIQSNTIQDLLKEIQVVKWAQTAKRDSQKATQEIEQFIKDYSKDSTKKPDLKIRGYALGLYDQAPDKRPLITKPGPDGIKTLISVETGPLNNRGYNSVLPNKQVSLAYINTKTKKIFSDY